MNFRSAPFAKIGVSLLGVLSSAVLAVSCSKSDPTGETAAGGNADEGGGAASSGDAAGSAAVTTGGTLSLGGFTSGEPGAGAGRGRSDTVSRDEACAESTDTALPLPPILQLVIDTSGSMDWPPGWAPKTPDDSKPPGATKWEITRDALLKAVDSLNGDVALGASFYPDVEQEGDTCLLNQVALPIQLLGKKGSSARSQWRTAVNDVVPVGATPTHGAYLFGVQQLAASTLPGEKFMLLITDGTPTCTIECACNENNEPVDSRPLIEEAAAARMSGAKTFVIGSPGSEDTREVLSQLASEGGTAKEGCTDTGPQFCHFDMTREADLSTALGRALQQIATSLRSCEYPIPAPPKGKVLDPELVNVLLTPQGGKTATIERDPSESDCREGWQYSSDGSSIVLCGEACDTVRADPQSTVEVLFGCQTVKAPPK